MSEIRIKRIYEEPEKSDGFRVLVDRLWPRGFSKERAAVDLWMKEIAPSNELRKWFGHDPARWQEFTSRYRAELKDKGDLVDELRVRAKKRPLTLVYSARSAEMNQAVFLKELISG